MEDGMLAASASLANPVHAFTQERPGEGAADSTTLDREPLVEHTGQHDDLIHASADEHQHGSGKDRPGPDVLAGEDSDSSCDSGQEDNDIWQELLAALRAKGVSAVVADRIVFCGNKKSSRDVPGDNLEDAETAQRDLDRTR